MANTTKKRLCSESSIYCCGTEVITKLYRAWDVRNNVGKVTEPRLSQETKATPAGSSTNKSSSTS